MKTLVGYDQWHPEMLTSAIRPLERRAAKGLSAKEAELLNFGHRMMDYLDRQQARYERAARYPWLPVEPDPPSPE